MTNILVKNSNNRNIAIFFYDIIHYHAVRIAAFKELVEANGFTLSIFSLRDNAPDRPGQGYQYLLGKDINIVSHEKNINSLKTTYHLLISFKNDNINIFIIPGYNSLPAILALLYARSHSGVAILLSASKMDSHHSNGVKKLIKSCLIKLFDAALVGGCPQRTYLRAHNFPEGKIFCGYNVVDNMYYSQEAEKVKSQAKAIRQTLSLPRPFFLFVGRFIVEKNLVSLLQSYRLYRDFCPGQPWDLVLCGSGILEKVVHRAAVDIPGVHFPGYLQTDEITPYYGLASCFILASISETWGLVVNEAMASGLPVLVSKACGCAQDLVQEGVNGYTFDPYDVAGLARLMVKMSSGEVDLEAMGQASQKIISAWTPEVFAENLFKAVQVALADRQRRKPWWRRLFVSSL